MPEPFHPTANTVFKFFLFGGVVFLGFASWMTFVIAHAGYRDWQNMPRSQPVPFSHAHHVGKLGIDCRFCHTGVETSSFAGIPAAAVCMHCHSQIYANAPVLAPVRESYRTGKPIAWTRVYAVPQFAYFSHSIHVHKGIGCSTCHGRVDRMPLTWQEPPLVMAWCLGCHRHPEQYVRPVSEVFDMAYLPPRDQEILGKRLVREYRIRQLTSCSICHR